MFHKEDLASISCWYWVGLSVGFLINCRHFASKEGHNFHFLDRVDEGVKVTLLC